AQRDRSGADRAGCRRSVDRRAGARYGAWSRAARSQWRPRHPGWTRGRSPPMSLLRTPKAQLFLIFGLLLAILVPSGVPLTNLLVALLTAGVLDMLCMRFDT